MEQGDNRKEQRSFLSLYIQEVFEAAASIIIIQVAMDKEVEFHKVFTASLGIGFLTYVLEQYNPDFKSNVSQGITFTVGSQIMSRFT